MWKDKQFKMPAKQQDPKHIAAVISCSCGTNIQKGFLFPFLHQMLTFCKQEICKSRTELQLVGIENEICSLRHWLFL